MKTAPKKFLHTISVMAGLDEEALRFLYALAREEHYPAGGIIVGEGEPGNRMFFIASGSVAVVKNHGTAQAVTLAQLGRGEFFGEMSLVESVTRSASVVAVETVTASTLKGADFHRLYRHRPDQYGIVMLNLARDLSRRLRVLDDKFSHLAH